jgi:rhodanese-related sulfurtransferase
LTGCSNTKEEENMNVKTQYIKISPAEAKEIMDNEETIVLDVRTKQEYDQGHIEGSVLLPVDEISAKAEEVLKDKEAKILVYCRSGNRSATAAKTLIEMGYENVLDFGGIIDWPYEIVK